MKQTNELQNTRVGDPPSFVNLFYSSSSVGRRRRRGNGVENRWSDRRMLPNPIHQSKKNKQTNHPLSFPTHTHKGHPMNSKVRNGREQKDEKKGAGKKEEKKMRRIFFKISNGWNHPSPAQSKLWMSQNQCPTLRFDHTYQSLPSFQETTMFTLHPKSEERKKKRKKEKDD